MYQTNNPNNPATRGGYVPYFYYAGHFLFRDLPGPKLERPAEPTYAVYDFSSDLIRPHRPYHPQTVEQIIARGYFAVPRGDPTTALISDRKATAWLGLDDLIGQIRNRYEIYERNLYEMKLAQCAAANSLHGIIADRGSAPAMPREVYAVQKQLQEIYQEEREERVNLWRDVSRLRVTIAEVAQQYLSAYRKVYFLDAAKGDQP